MLRGPMGLLRQVCRGSVLRSILGLSRETRVSFCSFCLELLVLFLFILDFYS